MRKTILEKLWARVVLPEGPEGCWIFTGCLHEDGYGRVWPEGKVWRAHRLAWFIVHGKLPRKGLVLDHKCEERAWCNPDHLDAVMQNTNVRRAFRRPASAKVVA